MPSAKATERKKDFRQQDSRQRQNELRDRYGKIGISAVAAAVRHQSEQQAPFEPREPYDRD